MNVLLFILLHIVSFVIGATIAIYTIISALRTFVLPRSAPDLINRTVFIVVRYFFEIRRRRMRTFLAIDRAMELYAPVSLIMLLLVWLISIQIGYMGMYWAVDNQSFYDSFKISGSSLLTLGFTLVDNFPTTILTFSEATIGLILVALLIAYLPTIYAAFARRESAVTMLEVRAGAPPSAVEMLIRYSTLKRLDKLGEIWLIWEALFVDMEESHTSFASLSFLRSPQPQRSWVTASGTVLDAAALTLAAVDIQRDTQADLCIRAGYLALRYIASFFRIDYNPNPSPDDPISITRAEFEVALDEMQKAGVPLKADREQAWRDFAGWRVNYDTVLLSLAELTVAPVARWSSDRQSPNASRIVRRWRGERPPLEKHEWIPPSNMQ
ncbi:MAG: hypothetical protein NVS2B12_35710 [Ktedonobacteraceae bacterium]